MKSRVFSIIALMAVAVFIGSASFANVPPPPANQLIGVDDTLFNNQTEAQCRECHTGTVDMHHMLYGTALPAAGTCSVITPARPCLSNTTCETLATPVCNTGGTACPVGTCSVTTSQTCIVDEGCPLGEVCNAGDCPNFRNGEVCGQPFCSVNSAVIDDDAGNDGIDTNYGCLNCHKQQIVGGVIKFIVTRDCLVCHVQNPNAPTVHHRDGGDAKNGICSSCHGDIVDNIQGCKNTYCGTDRGATQLIPCTSNSSCTAALVPQKLCRISGEPCTTAATCPLVNGGTQTCVNQLWCGYYGATGTENCTDGHQIPTYAPSMVTPTPSQHPHVCETALTPCDIDTQCPAGEECMEKGTCLKSDGTGSGATCAVLGPAGQCTSPETCVAVAVERAGGCAYCHEAGIATAPLYTSRGVNVDVVNNHDTHHDIFLHKTNAGGNLTQMCSWCHKSGYPHVPNGETPDRIRWCENCHGYESLHNIQADSPKSPTGTIVVGGEDAYWGHVGKDNPAAPNTDSDCWGCHGFSPLNGASAAPGTGPIIPSLAALSASTVTAGAETALTLIGTAFTNITDAIEYSSNVEIAGNGIAITVTPDAISQGSITATIPALEAGIYEVRIVKDTVKSNPMVISCVPKVEITSVTCEAGVLTVTGSGFGDQPPAGADEFINCKLGGIALEIVSWTDTQIVANTAVCGTAVTVNGLYGSASFGAAACAGNFDADQDVDGTDASAFKGDFGRSVMVNPCTAGALCNGDFNCDGDVDGSDAAGFKADFGKSAFNNPCAAVPAGTCSY